MKIKHSVLMVCYNQEAYIAESLDSIINQSESPYEIIVLDDCSTDSTWLIIEEYKKKYPIIKAFRNETNQGIFKNVNAMEALYSGNVISWCPGDDLLGKDCIKTVNDVIRANNVNPDIDKFVVVTNSMHLHQNGKLTLWDNFKEKDVSSIKTRLRYSLSYRSIGFSKAHFESVTNEYTFGLKYSGLGYGYDFLKGFDEIIKADKIFFTSVVGGIYRIGVGVTSARKTKDVWVSMQKSHETVKLIHNDIFDKKDFLYLKFIHYATENRINPSFTNWFRTLILWFLNLGNFGYNNPAFRNLHFLLPISLVDFLKKNIYNYYVNLRTRIYSK